MREGKREVLALARVGEGKPLERVGGWVGGWGLLTDTDDDGVLAMLWRPAYCGLFCRSLQAGKAPISHSRFACGLNGGAPT